MTRRHQLLAPIAAALILLAGCTGSSDDAKSEAKPDDSAPSPSQEADAATDPCRLISAESLAKVNLRDNTPRAALMTGRDEFVGCLIGDAYDFSFGYRAVDTGPSLKEQVGPASKAVSGIGDEAYIEKSDYAMVVGARFGDQEIIVRNDSLGNADPENRTDEKTTMSVVEELGEGLPDDLAASAAPVELGEGCPAADSKVVVSLVGSVVLARGGTYDDFTNCDYLGKGGSTIGLSRSDASNASDFLGNSDLAKPADIDGVVKAEISESPRGDLVELVIQPTKGEIAFVNASRGIKTPDDEAERKVAGKDVLALTKVFLDGTS